nr:uncharacterized protein LOC111429093 [Onthophagus taurus]
MARPIELSTEDKLEYNFLPNSGGFLQFRVRAPHDAHIALCGQAAECDPMYEVFIGGWENSKSVIRKNRAKPDVAEASTPGILNGNEFRGFWIRWSNGTITVGQEGSDAPFLNWSDSEMVPINYVGVCTGWGASGNWIVEQASPSAPSMGACGTACWVQASGGHVPANAFAGGEENGEPMFVIRSQFEGGLIPGKLLSSHGVAYVPWGGTENPCNSYEVLTDFNGSWITCSGSNIPPNALPAGQSEDGEPLYVGRVVNDGSMTVGKVHGSHGVCYIPFGGQEMGFNDYEILVS